MPDWSGTLIHTAGMVPVVDINRFGSVNGYAIHSPVFGSGGALPQGSSGAESGAAQVLFIKKLSITDEWHSKWAEAACNIFNEEQDLSQWSNNE
ncbi:hypothetical protein NDU88_001968 [Pleurodeles waltl]|uniref:Uncharacterized protein n=1 Tax=Pleurodeles waltl TaxID=8319 RepID=A0AAV7T249_PLEWA|nr:hypothetical protein NDU88_001968 [Pleurodeles waltl]